MMYNSIQLRSAMLLSAGIVSLSITAPAMAQSNDSTVTQTGDDNAATVTQIGTGNASDVTQSGTVGIVFIDQDGTNNSSTITQSTVATDPAIFAGIDQ